MDATRPPVRDLEKPVHLQFIKASVLNCSFRDPLKPQQSRGFLGKGGDIVARGSCWWFGRSGEQWRASYFILGKRALDGPDFDGDRSVQKIQGLDVWLGQDYYLRNWPGEKSKCKKETTEKGILSHFPISWNPYTDIIRRLSGLNPNPKERLRRACLCQVGSISDKLTMLKL